MKKESYIPLSLNEALEILVNEGGTLIGGATDITVKTYTSKNLALKIKKPLIFLNKIKELKGIEKKDKKILIKSENTYTELLNNNNTPDILKSAISSIAAPAIRNLATISGNICNASPAGDTLPVLYSLNAEIEIFNQNGFNTIPINKFIVGPGKTILDGKTIVTGIYVDNLKDTIFEKFQKVGLRAAQTLSKFSVCFIGCNDSLRISFGAVAPTVVRSIEKEKYLFKNLNKIDFDSFFKLYSDLVKPIDDQRSTAEYRKFEALKLGFYLFTIYKNKLY